jgi:hypothetical protein
LIAPFFNDACSNVILEGRATGCKIIMGSAENSGANKELMNLDINKINIDYMGEQYLGVFKLLTGL